MATSSSTGFPDATTAGVPAGVTLTPSGGLIINTPGVVIQGLNITGSVVINAPNVTLLNCKITSNDFDVVLIKPGITGAVVQNCEIDNQGAGGQGIAGQGTFIANNIHDCADGIDVRGDNTIIQDNYIHSMRGTPDSHLDGIQADGGFSNLKIDHNSVINEQGQTSALMLDNFWGPIDKVAITNNLFVGGDYAVYINEVAQGQNPGGPVTNVTFTNNHIGGGTFGNLNLRTELGHTPVMSGNVEDGVAISGGLVTTGHPTSGGGGGGTLDAPMIASFSGDSGVAGDKITNDNTLTLTGTAAANSTVKVFDGTTQIGTATANSSGAWNFTTAALNDAQHTLTAKATNAAGQTSAASAPLNVTVDTHAPNAPTIASAPVGTNMVKLSGAAEAHSTVDIFDGGTHIGVATAAVDGTWNFTTAVLATGNHTFTAKAVDVAGNTGTASSPVTVAVSGTQTPPPAAPTIASFSNDSGKVGDHITNDNTLTLTGTAAANTTVAVFDGTTKLGVATVDGSGAWHFTTAPLADGGHSLSAKATDASGQTGSASSNFAVTVDTHAPNAPTLGVFTQDGKAIGAATAVDDFLLKGAAEANSTVSVMDGGQQIGTVVADANGAWSFDTGHVADGSHSYTSKATDVAGNTGTTSGAANVTVDQPDSPIQISNVFESWHHSNVLLKGTADASSEVKIFDGAKVLGTVTAASDGTWSFDTHVSTSTSHNLTAQEINSNGQVVGTSGSAILGSNGSNTLTGTSGNDVFIGNGHPDTFVFASNFGNDVIKDFRSSGSGHDVLQFSKSVFDSLATVLAHATQQGSDVVIATGSGDALTLKNTKLSALDKTDFHFA